LGHTLAQYAADHRSTAAFPLPLACKPLVRDVQRLYQGNIPAAVTYTVTSQRSGEVRTFGQRPIAEKYFDQELARSQGRERI
jgi:hypothetical protein